MRLLYCGTHTYEDGSKTCYLTHWFFTGKLIVTNFLNPEEQFAIAKKYIISHDNGTDTYIIADEVAKGLKTVLI